MLIWLILIPVVFALVCLALRGNGVRQGALVVGAGLHLAAVGRSWWVGAGTLLGGALGLDPLGHLFITLISVLFLATAIYYVGYHQKALVSQRIFVACMLALLGAMTMVCASQHLGIMWVALETASLAATPLIYFRLGARALEATWKFLLMNSVGIALALMGIFCLALASTTITPGVGLRLGSLVSHAGQLDVTWLRAGFLLCLVGFGTKMGLAPMHSWKPDAYGEAPPPIAAFLAGGMTLGAFLGILRIYQIVVAGGLGEFAGFWMVIFGLLSIATAAVFIIGNHDYRRILAYTSVEHMGVLVLGVGLGSLGAESSMLHALHNTLNKGALFFVAGFLWRLNKSNRTDDVRGTLRQYPLAGIVLLGGVCATLGVPPFGMFFSELGMLLAAGKAGQWWVVAGLLGTLTAVFVGVMTALAPMAFGEPKKVEGEELPMPGWGWRRPVMMGPAVVLIAMGLGLGVYQPEGVRRALHEAAGELRGEVRAAGSGFGIQGSVKKTDGENGRIAMEVGR